MRLISQHGNVDIPYEKTTLLHAQDYVIARIDNKVYVMGEYSSMEKSYKAMEMLRQQYMKLGMIKILASGTCEYMDRSLPKEEKMDIYADYCKKHIFQFPKDEEVEV